MKSSGSKWPTLIVVGLSLFAVSASATSFDDQPHVLITVGHTNSAEWDEARGKYVATCDYKTLDGRIPRKGEACDGSPRLAISVEDLQSLRYITQASDHMEFVRRVYERFPRILIVSSPNYSVDYKSTHYGRDAQVINLREVLPIGIKYDDYDFLASRARDVLITNGSGIHNGPNGTMGTIVGPYSHISALGGTLENKERILSDYSLIFVYKNPDRTTLIHELVHFLISRAQERGVIAYQRYQELERNYGKASFLARIFFADDFDESAYDPKDLAHLDLSYLEYLLENRATSSPGEMEVAYFIAKFGRELGVPEYAVTDHKVDFWRYVDRYKESFNLFTDVLNGYAPDSAVEPINLSYSYVIEGREIPAYFRKYWERLQVIADSYPKTLLGDENNVNRRNPRTIIDHFVVDIGPRSSTTAQR
jgi:hypothetical protein